MLSTGDWGVSEGAKGILGVLALHATDFMDWKGGFLMFLLISLGS